MRLPIAPVNTIALANTEDVIITSVERGSSVAKAAMRTGSQVNMVGQEQTDSPDEVFSEVKQVSVLLRVEQNGQSRFLAVKFAMA